MSFFDIFKGKNKAGSRLSSPILLYEGGIRLEQAQADVMFITKGDALLYTNNQSSHLFSFDENGDRELNGLVVHYIFTPQRGDGEIEMFIAFDKVGSYDMLTLQISLEDRINHAIQEIFNFIESYKFTGVFKLEIPYATQYQYAFSLFERKSRYLIVNNNHSQAFLVDQTGIMRGDTSSIRTKFWKGKLEASEVNKNSVEEQPSKDQILDGLADLIYQIVSSKIETKEVAYQFILEELEAASRGNKEAQAFVARNKFTADEYEGAMQNSMPEVDGPGGPQLTLLTVLMQTGVSIEVMASIRIKVVQKIINHWFVNNKSLEDVNWDEVF